MDKFYSNSLEDSVKSAFDKADDELRVSGKWDEMQQVLNKEMPVRKKKRRFIFWFAFAIVLVGGFWSFQLWKNNTSTKNIETGLDNKPVQNLKESQTSMESKTSKENQTSTDSQTAKDSPNPKDNSMPSENKKAIDTQIKHEETRLSSLAIRINRVNHLKKTAFRAKNEQQKALPSVKAKSESAIEKSIISKDGQVEIKANSGNESSIDFQPKTKEGVTEIVTVKPVLSDSLLSVTDTASQPEQSIIKQRKQTKWHWNLSFAPDFLLANIQPFYRPGVSLGLGINYQFSPKWAIRTGLLYNYTPIYESGATYIFKPSPNLPAYNTLELKQVRGNLHVFEVPLSARFTATPNKKLSFMGSVGLSSLFFVRQNLTYDLLLNGNSSLSWNSQNDSDDFGESHILSNLVIGTGISIKMKRNAVVEFEPVFKLPLEELGEGHSQLGTIAIYLHLKYPIFKQKK